jgi:hypothetical protein
VFEDMIDGDFTTSNPLINQTWEPVYIMNKITKPVSDVGKELINGVGSIGKELINGVGTIGKDVIGGVGSVAKETIQTGKNVGKAVKDNVKR